MSRKKELTEQESKERKIASNKESIISVSVDPVLKSQLSKFWNGRYRSRNSAIIDLIKTHPDFKSAFPKEKIVSIRGMF